MGTVDRESRPVIPGDGPQTVAALLAVPLATDPDAPALVSRHARLTFAELDGAVRRAMTVLGELGVGTGDRVACSIGNHAEIVVAFLAAMRLGAVWVGVNTSMAPPEMAYVLDDAGVQAFVGEPDAVRKVLGAGVPCVEVDPSGADSQWHELLRVASPAPDGTPVDPFAAAAIAYTSGTTGRPKGVVHSQHNMLLPGAVAAATRPDPFGRPGVCLPLTILNLMILGPVAAFQQSLPCVLMDRVDPLGIASWVRDEGVTTFSAVPAMIYDLLTHPGVSESDLATLVRPGVGGAGCSDALRAVYRERFGTRVLQGYGLTEAPTAVAQEDPSDASVPGSAGRALPHVRLTVRDDAGVELPPGAIGEICIEAASDGPFAGVYTPMLGYWKRDEETRAAFWGSAVRTGDIGRIDASGFLFVTDRKSDMIIRGGANVYPAEVERVLCELPGVAAAAVVGLPDARLGERVVAAVVAAEDAVIGERAIQEQCRAHLAAYKVPDRVLIVDALPRNAMGKVVRAHVLQLFPLETNGRQGSVDERDY